MELRLGLSRSKCIECNGMWDWVGGRDVEVVVSDLVQIHSEVESNRVRWIHKVFSIRFGQ